MRKGINFRQWCINHDRKYLLDLWDDELNKISPSQVLAKSQDSYYFKCPNGVHESSLLRPCNVIRMKTIKYICKKCGSVAQALIDMYGENALDLYWDYEANTIDPWDIFIKSDKKIYIKCQANLEHGSYDLLPRHFFETGCRCPYCFHRRVLPQDSFAQYVIDNYGKDVLDKYWDYDKNEINPWELSPNGDKKVYMKWVKYPDRDSHLVPVNTFYQELKTTTKTKFLTREEKVKIIQDVIDGKYLIGDVQKDIFSGQDLTGKVFGRLTVLYFDYEKYLSELLNNKKLLDYWVCQCSCGGDNSNKSVLGDHLRREKIRSCGCIAIEKVTGENNPRWQGGINSENHKARHTPEGEMWRKSVLKRDGFTCQCCGSHRELNVHHLYNFVDNIELRYDISNGIVLCEECHSMTRKDSFHHMYTTKNNTPEQLREYIMNKSNIDIYETHPEILQLINTKQNDYSRAV